MDGHTLCISYGSLDVLEDIMGLMVADVIATLLAVQELLFWINDCFFLYICFDGSMFEHYLRFADDTMYR